MPESYLDLPKRVSVTTTRKILMLLCDESVRSCGTGFRSVALLTSCCRSLLCCSRRLWPGQMGPGGRRGRPSGVSLRHPQTGHASLTNGISLCGSATHSPGWPMGSC